jgi:hypothetical protein
LQIIADGGLPNYESEIKHLGAGCSVSVLGEIKESAGKGQATELHARELIVHGWCDPESYPLQKKRHTFEKLREWAHLRPRTNTFGAVARVRNCVSRSIHNFFQERGFLYVNTPIITASDCEGAGEMFNVTTLDLQNPPNQQGKIDYAQDLFDRPSFLTVSGQLEGEAFACSLGKIYTFGPTFRAEMLDFALVVRQLAVGDDLQIVEGGAVVEFQKAEAPLRVAARANPASHARFAANGLGLTGFANGKVFHRGDSLNSRRSTTCGWRVRRSLTFG